MSKLQYPDGRFRPNPTLTNPLYASYDLPKNQQLSPIEDDKLLQLKRENQELMKSLGLYSSGDYGDREKESFQRSNYPNPQQEQESFMSPGKDAEHSYPRYTYGTTDSTQRNSVPQTPDLNEYQYTKKKTQKSPLSLDLKALLNQEETLKKQVQSSTVYNPNVPNSMEDREDRRVQYFQYTDFDDYVAAASKQLRQADVRSKVLELKNLAQSMKAITENPTEKNVTDILKRFGEHSVIQKKPLYQQVTDKDSSIYKNPVSLQQSVSQKTTKSPTKNESVNKPNILIKAPSYNDASYEKKAAAPPHNSNYSSSKHSEKNESFEAFLYDQGVAPALFNQNSQSSPGKQDKNVHIPILEHQGTSEFPDLLDVKAVAAFLEGNGANIHSSDLMSSLQFFLLQNLKEISQIKDLLKNEESMSPIARAFNKKMRNKTRKSIDNGVSINLPLDDNEDEELEKKLKEAQTDRLIKKLQASNKRIQELENENQSYKEMEQTLTRSFKAGKVLVSFIRFDLDTSQITLEDINDDFEFETRFLVVTPTTISLEPLKSVEEEEEERGLRNPEPTNEIPIVNIDHIAYLEKPGSNVFFIKMSDPSREKPKVQDPKRPAPVTKSGFADNKPVIYIIQIEDQREVMAWELAFFITNFRILAKNVQFSYIRREFMQSIKLFVNKYLECNGDNTLIFGDASSQANGKPPLHPLATFGNIKQSTLEVLPDVIQEANRTQTPAMATVAQKVHELMKPTKYDPLEAKQDNSVRLNRQIMQKMKVLPQKKVSPFDDDAGDSDEVRSNISQNINESEKLGVASFEDGVIPEDNKSTRSIKSNNGGGYKKRAGADISETFSKYLTFLLEGVALEKFGKWGTKKEKLVRISNDFTGIEWVDPMKPNANKVPDFIMIESVTRIELASRAAFFQKKNLPEPELALCFTIISTEKNLNFKAPDPKRRDNFIEALQFVLSDKPKLKKMTTIAQTIKSKAH